MEVWDYLQLEQTLKLNLCEKSTMASGTKRGLLLTYTVGEAMSWGNAIVSDNSKMAFDTKSGLFLSHIPGEAMKWGHAMVYDKPRMVFGARSGLFLPYTW